MYQIKFVQYSKFQPGIWWNQNQNELYSYASSQSSPEILLVWKILDKLDIFFYFKILQFYGSYVSPGQNKKSADLWFAVSWLLKLKIVEHALISNTTQTINNGERKNPDHVHAKRDIIEIFLVYLPV